MKRKHLLSGIVAALAAAGAMASPTYSTLYQGVTFTFNQTDSNSFTLRIQGAVDATGDWEHATKLDNLQFGDLGFDPTGGTLTPGGWAWQDGGLNANGCSGSGAGVCFDAMPPVTLTNDLLFTIDLTGGSFNLDATHRPHLKLRFLDAQGNKEGSLLSQSMTFVPGGQGDPDPRNNVPEPASLALTGLALVSLGAVTTRRRKNAEALRAALA